MLSKNPYALLCCAFFVLPRLGYSNDNKLQTYLPLIELAVTAAMTRFIGTNATIKKYGHKIGIPPGELATVTGLMGGCFSFPNIPIIVKSGWLIPPLYACYKISRNKLLNYVIGSCNYIGEHLASRDICYTREIMANQKSELYGGPKDLEMYEVKEGEKKYEGPTSDNIAKTGFATVAITTFLYMPVKYVLKKSLDYPNCMINLSGQTINNTIKYFTNK